MAAISEAIPRFEWLPKKLHEKPQQIGERVRGGSSDQILSSMSLSCNNFSGQIKEKAGGGLD